MKTALALAAVLTTTSPALAEEVSLSGAGETFTLNLPDGFAALTGTSPDADVIFEAVLTGESFPVQKLPGVVAPAAGPGKRTNSVFLGTNVRSGTARCIVAATGAATVFGGIAHRLTLRPPENEFDRGVRRFGYLLTTAMLIWIAQILTVTTHLEQTNIRVLPWWETVLHSMRRRSKTSSNI